MATRLTVTSYSNPIVKDAQSLRNKKQRKASGRFLAEGARFFNDAHISRFVPDTLFVASDIKISPQVLTLVEKLHTAGTSIIDVPVRILTKITGKDNPQPVAAIFREPDTTLSNLSRSSSPIWLVARKLRDPGNLGTLLRTGDAVGAGGLILLDDCTDPFSIEAVRASMGAIFTVAIAQAGWDEFLSWLRSGPGQLVAASLNEATPYRSASYEAPCFILIGNESDGLTHAQEQACDVQVKLPMQGKIESLNAAMAGTVLAYEVLAQLGQDAPSPG